MRALAAIALLLIPACVVSSYQSPIVPQGGSVADFDRGTGTNPGPVATAPPPGPAEVSPGAGPPSTETGAAAPPVRREGALVAGPPQAGRLIRDPETIRAIQRALSTKGYYHGPIDGQADAALAEGLRRFQADHGLPVTGDLDGNTAHLLDVQLPPPPAPGVG